MPHTPQYTHTHIYMSLYMTARHKNMLPSSENYFFMAHVEVITHPCTQECWKLLYKFFPLFQTFKLQFHCLVVSPVLVTLACYITFIKAQFKSHFLPKHSKVEIMICCFFSTSVPLLYFLWCLYFFATFHSKQCANLFSNLYLGHTPGNISAHLKHTHTYIIHLKHTHKQHTHTSHTHTDAPETYTHTKHTCVCWADYGIQSS